MTRVFSSGIRAVGVIAALLVSSSALRGDGREGAGPPAGGPAKEAKGDPDRKAEKHVDRQVRIAFGGGAFLGVRLEDVSKDDLAVLKLSEERGALVKGVEEGSPAKRAGVQEGDVILRFGAEAVTSAAQLARMVRETPVGRSVALEVSRGGAAQKLSATLAESPGAAHVGDLEDFELRVPPLAGGSLPPVPPLPPELGHRDGWGRRAVLDDHLRWLGGGPRKLGLQYQELSEQLARYFKLSEDTGLLVTSVEPEGPAAKGGIKAGDVILRLDGKTVLDGDDLHRATERIEAGKEITVTVQRDGHPLDLKVTPGGPHSGRAKEEAEMDR